MSLYIFVKYSNYYYSKLRFLNYPDVEASPVVLISSEEFRHDSECGRRHHRSRLRLACSRRSNRKFLGLSAACPTNAGWSTHAAITGHYIETTLDDTNYDSSLDFTPSKSKNKLSSSPLLITTFWRVTLSLIGKFFNIAIVSRISCRIITKLAL